MEVHAVAGEARIRRSLGKGGWARRVGCVPEVIDRQVAHLKHLLDGRDAGDRVLAELADAIGDRSQ